MTIETSSGELPHKNDEAKATDNAAAAPAEPAVSASAPEAPPAADAPADKDELRPEQANNSYYAEASLTKKLIVFAASTAAVLIALGLIFAFWPLGGRQ